ncbi:MULTISPECIES: type IV pilus modification protein PilV [unclassified Luteimonas]
MNRNRRSRAAACRRRQQGMSLIEVLVAVLIMGIGLLGIAAMQAVALRNGQSSLERTQAVIQSYAILDVVRSNRANALAGYYNTPGTNPQCAAATASGSETAGQTSARTDVNAWLGSLKSSMVSAANAATDTSTCGGVSCVANTIDGATCTITVQWDDSRGTGTAAGREGSSQRRVVTVAAI